MKEVNPLIVDVAEVKSLDFGETYQSRMILDHVITGRDNVIQINHGTVKVGTALPGATHDDDEIYYILSGKCKLKLGDVINDIHEDEVIFIPKGCFHALDNREGVEDLKLLTFWRDYRFNEAYEERIKRWGKSFKTINED